MFTLGFFYTDAVKLKVLLYINESINQSINQLNVYIANIPGVATLSGTTGRLVFKYKVVEAIL